MMRTALFAIVVAISVQPSRSRAQTCFRSVRVSEPTIYQRQQSCDPGLQQPVDFTEKPTYPFSATATVSGTNRNCGSGGNWEISVKGKCAPGAQVCRGLYSETTLGDFSGGSGDSAITLRQIVQDGTANKINEQYSCGYVGEREEIKQVTDCKCSAFGCPGGSVTVTPSSIYEFGSAAASAPSGWSGCSFASSNPAVATVTFSSVWGAGPGTASISASGCTAPNGATGCSLGGGLVTVNRPNSCPSANGCGGFSINGFTMMEVDYCADPQDGCVVENYFVTSSPISGADCCGYWTPILIDVEGNGFGLTDAAHGVLFDFFGWGVPLRIAWTQAGSDDAWLVLDRNENGVIDNATEMFGNVTEQPRTSEPNGFLALAEFDKPENGGNGDGKISNADPVWPRLRLWTDKNHNGQSEPDELTPVALTLGELDLRYRESRWVDMYGNKFRYRGRVKPVGAGDGGRWAYDVFLVGGKP